MGLASYVLSFGVAALGVVLVTVYFYMTRKFGYWRERGVKHLKPIPFVGNLKDVALMRKNIGMVAKEIYEEHKKEPFIGMFAFDEPVLQIHDLDLVKAVLVKDSQYFVDRSLQSNEETDPLSARSLFGLKGERWKHSRNAITPSFTSGKMKRMYELVAQCGELLVSTVEKEKHTETPVVVYELAARYTTDIIASCAFGIQGNTLEDPKAEFRRILKLNFEFSPKQVILMTSVFLAPKLAKTLGLKVMNPEVENFVRDTIQHTMKEREVQKIQRNDLLDSLIQLKKYGRISEEGKNGTTHSSSKNLMFDEEDVCGHSFAFLAAGFETSATTISFILFELALNAHVQGRLREELQQASTDGAFSYEALHGIKYLDMVMQETLRKYPPLPFLDRMSNRAYTLPGTKLTLEQGSRILVPLHAFHMDPDFHPNPKQFDPERFSEGNKKNIINYSFMPFGEGPRNCVGMRFALMQTKSAIAHLLMKYSVQPCNKTPQEIKFNPKTFLLQPKENFQLVFNRLS